MKYSYENQVEPAAVDRGRNNGRWAALFFVWLILAGGPGSDVSAQYAFGKNKVHYTRFDWKVMTTEHFHIYFYSEELEVAQIAARVAEDAYREMAAKFNHEMNHRIPLIIYSSPSYFAQTNVTPELLPESVGGFTEFLKGRVVVPFHGSYHDFVHVIYHEMVHAFMIDKLDAVVARHSSLKFAYPPLWFTEGLAEFWSQRWDTEADMILKDMVVNDMMLPISSLYQVQGSYFMYKLGESICNFIDTTYGSDRLSALFDNWYKGQTFEEIVAYTMNDNLDEISRKWQYALKKRYFPEMSTLGLPNMESRQLSKDGYSAKGVPIHWDNGKGTTEWIVYKANRLGYTGIYMKSRNGGKDAGAKTLLKGERSSKFESLYLLSSGIDANDSGRIVFSSKSHEHDVIYLYELREGKVTRQYDINGLIASRSPRLSPDGRKVVFSGVKEAGFSDLYLLDLDSGAYDSLTNDIYMDIEPTFSVDGNSIIFVSDRGVDGRDGANNIFSLSLVDRKVTQITYGPYDDHSPDATPQGIYFSSNRTGVANLFLLDSADNLTQQSTYVTGAFDPRLSSDGRTLVYTGYQEMQFQVYEMDILPQPQPVEQLVTRDSSVWQPRKIDQAYSQSSVNYQSDYSFDIAQSSVAYDPVYGSLGGFQAAVSDMLGNRAFYILVSNTADTKDDFLTSFNFGLTYINMERRLNWGVGLFHLYDEYYNDYDLYFNERQAGGILLLSYPLSKFNRVDFSSYERYSKRDRRYGLKSREAFLSTQTVSWIYDNAIWDISGPIEGRRYNFSVGMTYSLSDGRMFNRLALADIRHYFRLGKYSAFANRMFAYTSSGIEPQRLYLGGSWSFRGYERREFYSRNILFTSTELRFPLINNLLIGFPIGGLGFRGIRGALFFDTGSAWDTEFDQFLGSFGAGFRVNLGYVTQLRFDFARTTDFKTVSPNTDFDFFFGWNF